MSNKKICVVTGSRAEYGLLYPILVQIQDSSKLKLQLIVTTAHLSSEFGLTYKQIEEDGFFIDDKINNLVSTDENSSIAKSTGKATILLADSFDRLKPDMVLLLGDRYETHAAATSAMLMNIPIAHIHGGEITEGAVTANDFVKQLKEAQLKEKLDYEDGLNELLKDEYKESK